MPLERNQATRAAKLVLEIDALFSEALTATDACLLVEVIAAALPSRPAGAEDGPPPDGLFLTL